MEARALHLAVHTLAVLAVDSLELIENVFGLVLELTEFLVVVAVVLESLNGLVQVQLIHD